MFPDQTAVRAVQHAQKIAALHSFQTKVFMEGEPRTVRIVLNVPGGELSAIDLVQRI